MSDQLTSSDVAVWNDTKGQRLLGSVCRCASFLCRLRGLTFRRTLGDDEGLLLVGHRENRADTAIHMFFVFSSIAVLWLDARKRVVDTALAKPFRPYYAPRRAALYYVECAPEVMSRVHLGDELAF